MNRDHGDAVVDVAVNPVYMEWASASIDGHVRTYRYQAVKTKNKVGYNRGGGTTNRNTTDGNSQKGRTTDRNSQREIFLDHRKVKS